ncbi:MAG: EF2563 family selenium-dependent molybdenum hydroxylase system protein [Chloroflexi bacterium]|nr:EF2563 family selenium-dependent molybdenum hydroxylase system protein [Chloroflexota bacterium]
MASTLTVVVRGGGDLASGVAHRLHRAGCRVAITELPQPLVVRRTVAFASAVRDGMIEIEGVRARRVADAAAASPVMDHGEIAVIVDPAGELAHRLGARAVVDAIMAKTNTGTRIGDAPVVIALGPGFTAGTDCHAVVETKRGHNLGRVYYAGSAESDTHEPNAVDGVSHRRVLRAPCDGEFVAATEIGQIVAEGAVVGHVAGDPIVSGTRGCVRGLIADGTPVSAGLKVGDIDPRANRAHCYTISDKSRAIGGGALEALLHLTRVLH